MASDVGICNRALQKLGAGRITSLTEESVSARECNAAYETVRDATLRRHPWNFAIKRAQLAASATAPAFDFAYQYPLPTDCLRLLPSTTQTDWQIENGGVLTNDSGPLNVRYIARITDPNQQDALFQEALACQLALELCEKLTQSATKKQQAEEDLKRVYAEARKVNAFENNAAQSDDDPWIYARY